MKNVGTLRALVACPIRVALNGVGCKAGDNGYTVWSPSKIFPTMQPWDMKSHAHGYVGNIANNKSVPV